jgi:hypothetical protein
LLCALALGGLARADQPLDAGTSISVQVVDGGDTTISVKRGELKVRAGREEARLTDGQAAEIRRGLPLHKLSILPPPDKLVPADDERLSSLEVAFGWAAVPGARGYRLMVARDANFKGLVHDKSDVQAGRAPVKLAAGTYWWRVSAVDRDGLEGRASAPHKLVIDVTPPKLKAGKPQWK